MQALALALRLWGFDLTRWGLGFQELGYLVLCFVEVVPMLTVQFLGYHAGGISQVFVP